MEEEKNTGIPAWMGAHKKYLLAVLAAAVIVLIVYLVMSLRTFSSYETVSSYTHSRESNDQYLRFGGCIVQYGGDGITCLNADGTSLWSKSYEMEQPMLAVSDGYLAVADQGGSGIYLFDESGFLTLIETPYPIRQLALSDSGSAAVVLEESDACRLMLYSADGDILVEGEAHLDDSGYPAAIALSADGTTLAVSYLTVSSGQVSSVLTFYDFSATESAQAQAAASDTYDGEMIVRLAYLEGRFAAFSDAAVRIYGGSSLSLQQEIDFESQVQSIVIGTDRFGIVTASEEEMSEDTDDLTDASADASAASEDTWSLDIYGKAGRRITHAVFSGDYQNITFLQDGSVAILGTDSCSIITALGQTRFSCTFGEGICGIFSNGLFGGYTFVFSDRIERVRLQ